MVRAVILFTEKKAKQLCTLVTMDIGRSKGNKVMANSVMDVALYTEPEEIYLMKKNGSTVLYDATSMCTLTLGPVSTKSISILIMIM